MPKTENPQVRAIVDPHIHMHTWIDYYILKEPEPGILNESFKRSISPSNGSNNRSHASD